MVELVLNHPKHKGLFLPRKIGAGLLELSVSVNVGRRQHDITMK